ncbi:uncharacterized protein LOC121726104 [Aricia agestis]|uniref:uncharacterized protein LOC121726104 n=1 Tax=Aricia agestis TaxID=91739 RepID=UPI001C2048B7|nr:uncharacterized protein LOC121726104 [Aricia agestis]
MRRAGVCLLLLALGSPAVADVVFRVPEVLVRPISDSKPVGISATASLHRPNTSEKGGDVEVQYEEYFVEHDVSTAEARKAAALLNLDDIPATRVGCGTCTRREMEYCETRVLMDHCCCERHFLPEPFPWLPHTCYVGPHRCHPLAHDCVKYTRLRDCCCYKHLAQQWKGIMSKSTSMISGGMIVLPLLFVPVLFFVAYL